MLEAFAGRRRVYRVLVAGGVDSTLEGLTRRYEASGRGTVVVETRDADALTAVVGSPDHQGVAAEVDPYPYAEESWALEHADLIVALDRVQDPHNLGAIIRSAEVAGATVVIPRHRSAEVTPAVVKASAGATEHAKVVQARNLADFLEAAKRAGFWVYGSDASATAAHYEPDYRGKTVFVLGSEGEGLGRRVASTCDVVVGIPQIGVVGSLNVSVSAGVLLFEAVRQRVEPGPSEAKDGRR